MAVFRDSQGGSGRAAEDRRRHRQLVEDSIKKNIGKIIAEESIIGQSGTKKIKIPIRGLREYQFIFGKNTPGVGTGTGSEERGDVIRPGTIPDNGNQGAGSDAGEDIYETEITLEELINYLFDDLNLPFMERKRLSEHQMVVSHRKNGFQVKGPPPRLAKKRAVVEKIKRRQGSRRETEPDEGSPQTNPEETAPPRFPFREEDLRYRRIREVTKPDANAVVICIMDTSGSMDQTKKYLARSFYFLLYQFIRLKYVLVEVVFISHSTIAKEVTEEEFFHKTESGGTYISSGYERALQIIQERYPPSNWNIYAFHCSDGDNWDEDNLKAVELAQELCKVCNLFGYGEIMTGTSTIRRLFMREVSADNFALVTIDTREQIWPALQRMLIQEGSS
ncbi:MAG TPA: YeaH/YhbH family protein [Bacillota bacterium]|nr:YeaH/YhbH family protein [Bacillota bacterium]